MKKSKTDDEAASTYDLRMLDRKVTPSREWRSRLADAQKMSAEELADVVYTLGREGAPLKLIAQYYGLDYRDVLRVAGDAWSMANAELIIEIFRDQILTALNTKNVLAKIYVGKQFAGQRDAEPVSANLTDSDVGGLNINLNVIKATRDDQGNTQATSTSESEDGAASETGHADSAVVADASGRASDLP